MADIGAPQDEAAALAQHREARIKRLGAGDGWLSLVERVILDEGDNAVDGGSAFLDGGRVTLKLGADTHVWQAGDPGPGPFFTHGARRYELLRQGGKAAVRVRDPKSPTLARFRGVDFFPGDPRYRVQARVTGAPKIITLAVGLGADVDHRCPGTLTFTLDGRELSLDPVIEDDDTLFVIFKDPTNGKSTYGAGRFLYTPLPDADGRVVLDFNRCFNPPCALTEHASCPVVPPQNRLPVEIAAGEKYPLP